MPGAGTFGVIAFAQSRRSAHLVGGVALHGRSQESQRSSGGWLIEELADLDNRRLAGRASMIMNCVGS
jgi:hypothetical protein